MLALVLFLVAAAAGEFGPADWNWIGLTIMVATSLALVIVCTVPDHFLESHLWHHLMRTHVWTLAALLVARAAAPAIESFQPGAGQAWLLLAAACAIGLIPESGPHLVFVTLYAQHTIPFSVLLANSVVQDGHGMLPMLAHSRRTFVLVKSINGLAGLVPGALAMAFGY
jgi:hypothetical protein